MVYEDNSLSQNQQVSNNQPGLVGATPPGGQPTTATSTTGTTGNNTQSNGQNTNSAVQQFNGANRQQPNNGFTNIKSYINAKSICCATVRSKNSK